MHFSQLPAIFAFVACIGTAGLAQTAGPDVDGLAKKFDAEVAEIEQAKSAAIARIHQRYLEALRAAERTASSLGKVNEAAVILKETQAVADGLDAMAPTAGLHSTLVKHRADAVSAMNAVDREFAPRFQRLSASYLKSVAQIESTLPTDSPVRRALATLKTKVITIGAAGSAKPLDDSLFEHTEWLWMAQEDKVWKFLPDGKVEPDPATRSSIRWKITGPKTFTITADGSHTWEFQFYPAIMEGKGKLAGKPSDTKRLVFKRKLEP